MFGGSSDLLPGLLVIPAAAFAGLVVVLLGGEAWMVLVAGGAGLAGFGASRWWSIGNSRRWPRAAGTIVSAALGEYSVAVSKVSRRTYYFPQVEFTYTVRARHYSGTRAAFDTQSIWSADRRAIEQRLAQLAPGTPVAVYAHPTKPELAVLFPGLSPARRSHYAATTLAGALLAGMGYVVYLLRHA